MLNCVIWINFLEMYFDTFKLLLMLSENKKNKHSEPHIILML